MPIRTPLERAIFDSHKKKIVIAKRAGIHQTRLSKILNGHVDATDDEQKALARVLRRPIADLFPSPPVAEASP